MQCDCSPEAFSPGQRTPMTQKWLNSPHRAPDFLVAPGAGPLQACRPSRSRLLLLPTRPPPSLALYAPASGHPVSRVIDPPASDFSHFTASRPPPANSPHSILRPALPESLPSPPLSVPKSNAWVLPCYLEDDVQTPGLHALAKPHLPKLSLPPPRPGVGQIGNKVTASPWLLHIPARPYPTPHPPCCRKPPLPAPSPAPIPDSYVSELHSRSLLRNV